MNSILCDIVTNIINFFTNISEQLNLDMLFIIGLGVEVILVVFFLVKSMFSYEASLNRALDKLNFWLFERKNVTEENIRDLNMLFKTRAPKRLCYYWQQYILFREGQPSSYLSVDNLVEKPMKTSSYNSNIKNLSLFSGVWAFAIAMFVLLCVGGRSNAFYPSHIATAMLVPVFVGIIAVVFMVYLRARKNSILNSLYQNVALFGRFMDNACMDLPSYIDYQILFTPEEIEKGQPVLREFLDYKARKEKEEFNKAKEQEVEYEQYDFAETGVDGSIVLDRAMKESELYLKKKEKLLVKISQIEAELDSRRKNFDNVQKDYQTKIQASKENVNRLRQMQEETTNRIESNYYRKQQTQEIGKQEQFEQEFEQLRAKYLLEKNEGEEEIQKLNDELATFKKDVENAMIGEYQTFFDKFCHSAEKVVAKVFNDKIKTLKEVNDKNNQYITELEIKLKNVPQGPYDAEAQSNASMETTSVEEVSSEGKYDENGNYVYPNGTFYDPDGNFHDEKGNIYSQDGTLISKAEEIEKSAEEIKEEKKIVDFDEFDAFDFMTDISQKSDIYDVAENIINDVDKDNEIEIINNSQPEAVEDIVKNAEELEIVSLDDTEVSETAVAEQPVVEEKPKKKAGRPRKVVIEEVKKPAGKRGRPRKVVEEVEKTVKKVGRPKKVQSADVEPIEKKKVGRPKKIVKETAEPKEEKRGRGRPKKNEAITEINKKLSKEEAKMNKMRNSLNKELENAIDQIDSANVDDTIKKREQLLKEIDKLQKEAQSVMKQENANDKIAEINSKLESLLNEIKNLDA